MSAPTTSVSIQAPTGTIWESWERDFSKAEMKKDKPRMERIWLKAFLFATRHWRDIDPPLRPIRYFQIDHKNFAFLWGDAGCPDGHDVGSVTFGVCPICGKRIQGDSSTRNDLVSTWLGQMADWSRRKREQPGQFRR